MSPNRQPTLGIFASDDGPGDAERSNIMTQAGGYLARRGARIVCLAEADMLPVALVASARTGGGDVTLIGEEAFSVPSYLTGVTVEHHATQEARLARMAELCNAYIALPGSLNSAIALYRTWSRGGGGAAKRPIIFYDRNGAFKVVRGYVGDVVMTSVPRHEHLVQFADSIEEIWNKVTWLIEQKATTL